MLKRKTKIRKRLARIVLAALLCTGGMHGLAAPSVAEAATVITVSNITGDAATGDITVTADPAGSMLGIYNSDFGVFKVMPDAAVEGISEINITGSAVPAIVYGSNTDSADTGSRTVTVSGAATVLGSIYVNYQGEGIDINNNTLLVEDARITGIDSDLQAEVSAGLTDGGDASGNRIEIRNATIGKAEFNNAVVYAGYTVDKGNAADNSVTVEGEATKIYGQLGGGLALGGDATGNEVTVSGGTVGFEGMQYQVIGGGAVQTAGRNTVTIKGGTILSGAYGGASEGGAAIGNALNIEGGTVYAGVNWRNEDDAAGYDSVNLGGGFAEKGVASENTVTVNGGEFTGGERKLTAVCGGFSYDSDAVKNKAVVNGGTGLHAVFGGGSINGNAENNEVYINPGAYVRQVFGGDTEKGSATGNTVTVSGGTFGMENSYTEIDGGCGQVSSSNKVIISGGTFGTEENETYINGGYAWSESDNGAAGAVTANDNTVTVSGGTFGAKDDKTYVSAGYAWSRPDNGAAGAATANNNTVTVSGGTFGTEDGYTEISGGYTGSVSDNGTAGAATSNNNTVTVSGGTFGTEDGYTVIYGGYAWSVSDDGTGAATANNNSVTVSGNPVFKGDIEIIGGEADCETAEEASNNTVTILTPVTVYGLWGGYVRDDGTSAGNTLNIAAKNVTTTKAGYFQSMNFYLPADIANNDTMLTIKGLRDEETGEISGNDLTGVTFGVAAQTGADLAVGDTVNLVVGEQGLVTDDTLQTTDSGTLGKAEFLAMNNMSTDDQYGLSISKLGDNAIIATVDSKTPMNNEERHKSPAETRESVVTLVNAGADLLAGVGMQNAADAAAAERDGKDGAAAQGTGGYAPFAAVGVSSLRAQSGSHVDTKGIGLALGFARELKNKSGKLLVGPLLEYGYGRYDSYQDNYTKADGKSHYWGVGVIAKQTNDNGVYYEGSLRIGRTGSDYNRDDPVVGRMSYDSDATYFGAHLGIGRVQDIGHANTLDYYGKYFYSHTGGDSAFIHGAGVTANFDGVDSHRLRAGARVTHAVNEKNKVYGGLAYQYEFNGDARVTYSGGGNAPSPSVKGGSGMLELGWQVKPGRSPMVLDLNVTGWTGKQRGVSANLQANWTF